jgi:hypothetical protein
MLMMGVHGVRLQAVVDHTYSLRAAANAANATTTVRAKRGLRKRALPRNLQRQLMAGSTTLKVFLTKAGDNNTNLEAPSSSSGSGGVRSKSGSGDGAPGRSGHYPWSSPGECRHVAVLLPVGPAGPPVVPGLTDSLLLKARMPQPCHAHVY